MEQISYIGENLWAQYLGNAFIASALSFSILGALFYFLAIRKTEEAVFWNKWGRLSFRIHAISVIGIGALLLYLLFTQRFEFYYVWFHSNTAMEPKYILSCLWEGQEGSFWLWMFWHAILGLILQFTAKSWEAPVLFVVSLVQIFLVLMIVGIVIEPLDLRIGLNPFILLREQEDMRFMPFLQAADYASRIDGRGLNPLLMNYWMTIHPPTLFLGFASTLIPFAYALGALLKKDYNGWLKPALPWAAFGVGILGWGILMGGAWAYESLSFGGFWAWDPVENASLVPWLTLVAGMHLMLIYRNKGTSLFMAFFLIIISFQFVLWSTYLTRSGVLGETSVHAFTGLGMTGQLLSFVFFFAWLPPLLFCIDKKSRFYYLAISAMTFLAILLFGLNSYTFSAVFLVLLVGFGLSVFNAKKYFPSTVQEEAILSKEFILFVGAIILFLSGIFIIFSTSIPAFSKFFERIPAIARFFQNMTTPDIAFYNSVSIWFAFGILILMGIGQYMRYKETPLSVFLKQVIPGLLISLVITALISIFSTHFLQRFDYSFLFFTGIFAVILNVDYLRQVLKTKWLHYGSSIAHVGFGFVMLGSLLSAGHKKVISENSASIIKLDRLNADFQNNENILLHKGDTIPMGDYLVAYQRDSVVGKDVYFVVDYYKAKDGRYEFQFELSPKIQTNPRFGNVAEPSTQHFWNYDIYTYTPYADMEKVSKLLNPEDKDSLATDPVRNVGTFEIQEGDTIYWATAYFVFKKLRPMAPLDTIDGINDSTKIDLQGDFMLTDLNGKQRMMSPGLSISMSGIQTYPAMDGETGLKIELTNINPDKRNVEIVLYEVQAQDSKDYVIMQAIVFPYINILWLGCILLGLGSFLAMWKRFKDAAKE